MSRFLTVLFSVGCAVALGCATAVPQREPLAAKVVRPGAGERVNVDHTLILVDASDSISAQSLFPDAKSFVQGFVAGMPAGSYSAGTIAFGGNDLDVSPLAPFERSRLGARAAEIRHIGSSTPLPDALQGARRQLADKEGRVALVLISDGRPTEAGRREGNGPTLDAARSLIEDHVGELCLHTVQVGSDPKGAELLNSLSRLSPCGSFQRYTNIASTSGLHDYQRQLFLGAAPRRPEPPPVAAAPSDSDNDGVYDRDDRCPATPSGAKVDRRGCWAIRGAQFAVDSYAIRPTYRTQLDDVARVLKQNPGVRIRVDGHTDATGPSAYNQQLSEQRARAVVEYLVAAGVERSRLSVQGFGASKPVRANDTREGRQENRRTELSVVGQSG